MIQDFCKKSKNLEKIKNNVKRLRKRKIKLFIIYFYFLFLKNQIKQTKIIFLNIVCKFLWIFSTIWVKWQFSPKESDGQRQLVYELFVCVCA